MNAQERADAAAQPFTARIRNGACGILADLRTWLAARDAYDTAAAVLLLTLAAIVIATFRDYAISNDEEVQQHYGELILAYYRSGFADQAVFNFKNLYLYGGLFDIAALLLGKILPLDLYLIRHALCALIGVGGIAATFATARLIGGPRAGAIAAALLTTCGPWYGAMFNHTKDVPFAVAMMAATYFLLRCARDLPQPRWRDVLLFGVALGAALGQRATGLLMLGYVLLAIAFPLLITRPKSVSGALTFIRRSVLRFVPGFAAAYLIMIVAWPWAALAPLNPIYAITTFAHFHYPVRTVLDGEIYLMSEVPRSYVPTYLAIKLPLTMLIGVVAAFAFALWEHGRPLNGAIRSRRALLLVAISVGFPLLCQVALRGPAYTGLRHFLFVVPSLAVLAGIGLDRALRAGAQWRPAVGAGLATALAALLLWNTSALVRLHPYEYVFYNPLVGGLEGASRRYATDYWVNIMPEAVGDLETYVRELDSHGRHAHRYTVAVCGERLSFEKEKESDPRLQWTPDWKRADFFIAPTHMNCDQALEGKVIATVERVGVVIGVVKDRRALVRPEMASVPNSTTRK